MTRLVLLTPWIGSGTRQDAYRPLFQDRYPTAAWVDLTSQQDPIPDPNLFVIEVTCEDALADTIEDDDDEFLVLSREVVSVEQAT